MTDREKMKNAILDLCPYAVETTEYADGIGCCDRGVECDCFCREIKPIENAVRTGYRKMDEVTLRLDLGNRSTEEIKQIAEAFNGDIKKQVAKEILQEIRAKEEENPEEYDGWLVAVPMEDFKRIFAKYGVEIEK